MTEMTQFVINLVVFILSLAALIVIHEFGHFITAKMFKVYVNEFSIGFGPALFQKKKEGGETTFSIRAIPLGGFCAMVGEELPTFTEEEYAQLSQKDQELVDLYQTLPSHRRLDGIARWKRAIIMIAGVTLNFVLAFVLFICSYATLDYVYAYSNSVSVSENSLASKAGWVDSDVISSAEYVVYLHNEDGSLKESLDSDIYNCEENTTNLYYSVVTASQNVPVTSYDRIEFEFITTEDKNINLVLNANFNSETNTYNWPKLGITFSGLTRKLTFGEVMSNSVIMMGEGSVAIVKGLVTMFTPEGFEQVGGIISMFEMSSEVNAMGLSYYFYLWGLISVNLAVFNLLPFPGLDGWHFLVLIIESITRRNLPKKFKTIMQTIGMVLLYGLVIVITLKDIIGLF